MIVKAEFKGVKELASKWVQFPKAVGREVGKALGSAARLIQTEAKKKGVHRFKSRSGNLVRSIQREVAPDRMSASVFLDEGIANYGKYIHGGFKSWEKDEFVFKAAEITEEEVVERINKAIAEIIAKEF